MTPTQNLSNPVIIMIVGSGSIVGHNTDVREALGVLGIRVNVKKDPKAIELFLVTEGLAWTVRFIHEPESQAITRMMGILGLYLEGCLNEPVVTGEFLFRDEMKYITRWSVVHFL